MESHSFSFSFFKNDGQTVSEMQRKNTLSIGLFTFLFVYSIFYDTVLYLLSIWVNKVIQKGTTASRDLNIRARVQNAKKSLYDLEEKRKHFIFHIQF